MHEVGKVKKNLDTNKAKLIAIYLQPVLLWVNGLDVCMEIIRKLTMKIHRTLQLVYNAYGKCNKEIIWVNYHV